jgi:hypothetical protein
MIFVFTSEAATENVSKNPWLYNKPKMQTIIAHALTTIVRTCAPRPTPHPTFYLLSLCLFKGVQLQALGGEKA